MAPEFDTLDVLKRGKLPPLDHPIIFFLYTPSLMPLHPFLSYRHKNIIQAEYKKYYYRVLKCYYTIKALVKYICLYFIGNAISTN